MAIIHQARLTPTKMQVLTDWLSGRPWFAGTAGAESALVGTMQHSVLGRRWVYDGCADPVYLAALVEGLRTGRAQAPELVRLDGQDRERPPTASVLAAGGPPVPLPDGAAVRAAVRAPGDLEVTAEASRTVVETGGLLVVLHRRPRPAPADPEAGSATLTGTWVGQDTPALLAEVRRAG